MRGGESNVRIAPSRSKFPRRRRNRLPKRTTVRPLRPEPLQRPRRRMRKRSPRRHRGPSHHVNLSWPRKRCPRRQWQISSRRSCTALCLTRWRTTRTKLKLRPCRARRGRERRTMWLQLRLPLPFRSLVNKRCRKGLNHSPLNRVHLTSDRRKPTPFR